MPTNSPESELLREAWSTLVSGSDFLTRLHEGSIGGWSADMDPAHDNWEKCGCEVAVLVREMKAIELKLYGELERRGVFE
jgi:hypothetical protein